MSIIYFSFTGANALTANASSQKVVAVSSDSSDTTQSLYASGPVSGTGTTNTLALTGTREVISSSTFDSINFLSLSATAVGSISIRTTGTAAVGYCVVGTNPADGDTVTIGLTGYTQAYRFKNTPATSFDVKIGATASDTASNLKKAINADGLGDGSDYYAGTTANAYLTATVSTTTVTLTDKIACLRTIAWNHSVTGTGVTNIAPAGGANGTLIATITAGNLTAFDTTSLNSEDLSTKTVPALLTGASSSVTMAGRRPCLVFKCENITSAIALKYQTSTDGTNWADGQASITSLDNNSVTSPVVVNPTEVAIEYLRLNITTNANTTSSSVCAAIVYR